MKNDFNNKFSKKSRVARYANDDDGWVAGTVISIADDGQSMIVDWDGAMKEEHDIDEYSDLNKTDR